MNQTTFLIGGAGYECDGKNKDASGQAILCSFVTKYKYDANSKKIVSENWVYQPTKKTWSTIALIDDDKNFFKIFYQNYEGNTGDGKQWYNDAIDFKTTPSVIDNGVLSYSFGQAKFLLSFIPSNLTSNNKIQHTSGAESYNTQVNLVEGEYLSLDKRGVWSKSDDGNGYRTLGEYRNAHTNTGNVLCLYPLNWNAGIVFNSNQPNAQLYQLTAGCSDTIDTKVDSIALTEGVKTIGNKKVIYLSQKPVTLRSDEATSSYQYLYAIALNDKGIPTQGKAYQVGYAEKSSEQYYNKAALTNILDSQKVDLQIPLPF